jgi:hypothetical protein
MLGFGSFLAALDQHGEIAGHCRNIQRLFPQANILDFCIVRGADGVKASRAQLVRYRQTTGDLLPSTSTYRTL